MDPCRRDQQSINRFYGLKYFENKRDNQQVLEVNYLVLNIKNLKSNNSLQTFDCMIIGGNLYGGGVEP
jgi:hypothetical protein